LNYNTLYSFITLLINATMSTLSPSPRLDWDRRQSELWAASCAHKDTYFERVGNFDIYLHPSVLSPKYFPETVWFGENLPPIVQGKSFLEVGLGSGLVSLYLAASGSSVAGVDINSKAVEITKKNFEANGQIGHFVVSDVFENVTKKYDFIFWNHPWAWDGSQQAEDERLEMFLDEGYATLKRFISQAKNHLVEGGSVLLGTVPYANLSAIEEICAACGYTQEIVREGLGDLGNGVTEQYYIIQIRPR
jgi:HemK-related putative methylase